ncbi:MAG: ABC transporter ATP-binding protein [bacterium]
MTTVRLENLTKHYPNAHFDAVKDLTITVPAGGLVCLLGPSGCGKTTTLKMIAGLLAPDKGSVCFDDDDVTATRPEDREAVMVFQHHLLFPFMTVADNVAFGLKMRGTPAPEIAERVAAMLEMVRLTGFEHRRPNQLSSGQRQRVALARALVIEPRVLLLDEPLSNLDAHLRDEMRELILTIKQRLAVTIIFVTHDQEEAVLLADRIAVMFDGRIEQEGPSHVFYERPASERVAAFFGNRNCIGGEKHGDRISTEVGEFAVHGSGAPDGPVVMMIRPESIRTSDHAGGEPGENTLEVPVRRRIYTGTHTRYRILLGDREWEVLCDARSGRDDNAEHLRIVLPPEDIWVIKR